jgi:hypothetical protein
MREESCLDLKSWPLGYTPRSPIEWRTLVATCHARELVSNQTLRDVLECTTLEHAKKIGKEAIMQTCTMP